MEFLRIARSELDNYPAVTVWDAEVRDAKRRGVGFRLTLADGRKVDACKLLLATGLVDELPPIPGIDALYGKSVFHCPYCDGWEARGAAVAVYGKGKRALEMARALTAWTADIVVCPGGPLKLSAEEKRAFARNGIRTDEEPIARLAGSGGQLQAVVFASGRRLARQALFFDTASHQQTDLARRLGCSFTRDGGVRCGRYESTDVPGVYVAGNTIKDVHLVVVAAAEGAKAALGINKALTREQFTARATGRLQVLHPA